MNICDVCFNSSGDSRRAVNKVVFSETDETFDLCESHYQEMRELIHGTRRAYGDITEVKTEGA